ncbi:MAG: ATP-binding protein [Kofleriaceae bacterium]
MSGSSLQRLLKHAQQLITRGSADEILAGSCHEVLALTGATRAFASCSLPQQAWERGVHIESDRRGAWPANAAARSALFALHRRAIATPRLHEVKRSEDTTAMFRGLACDDSIHTIHVVPLIHRTGRVWGELALIDNGEVDATVAGLTELAQLATIALENAQRLAFARRDQDRLVILAEATDDALYDWDFDTCEFWWGGGIQKLLGSSADPVEPSATWKLERVHPEDRDRVWRSFDEARFAKVMHWESEYRFLRDDGSYCYVEDRAYFLRDATSRAYRTIGSVRNVSAMKHLLLREKEARAHAEMASRAKDEFLAMLGHELRNPLAPIISGLELLRMRRTIDPDRDLRVLQRQANHLIRLVDDLLDISRIAHGKIELHRERLEVSSVVAAAVETAKPLIESRSHALGVVVPEHGLVVHADRARLAQVIANLLTNSAKYTEPGGRIQLRARQAGDAVEISVTDNGIGIAPEMLATIFSMFVQERQALDRSRGGLGLGLAIVRNLVELHDGTVAVTSEGHNRGSEFVVRIPAVSATEVHVEQPPAPVEPRLSGRKIMVVDDNEDAAELLAVLLEQLGNTTRIAHDATGALEIFDEFAPDLAVLDIGLPSVDGYELARRIRSRTGPSVPHLIALTGYGQASDKERALRAGFDAHLVKPVEIDALQALMAELATSR